MTAKMMTMHSLIEQYADAELGDEVGNLLQDSGKIISVIEVTLAVVLGLSIGDSELTEESLNDNLKMYQALIEYVARGKFVADKMN